MKKQKIQTIDYIRSDCDTVITVDDLKNNVGFLVKIESCEFEPKTILRKLSLGEKKVIGENE